MNKNLSFYHHCEGSYQAIIFIHGILEGTEQFKYLAKAAYKLGYSVYALLLPGHGGSSWNFARTNLLEWVDFVSETIDALLIKYHEVILVGHSMGALLAICEGAVRKKGIRALVLIDPPLHIHLWPRVVKSAACIQWGKIRKCQPYTQAEYKAMSVGKIKGLSGIGWILRYSELLILISYTRKRVAKLKLPLLVVFAAKDEFVSYKSQKYFSPHRDSARIINLKDSGHFCYHHSDLLTLEKAYIGFIKQFKA